MQTKRFNVVTTLTVMASLMLTPLAEAKRVGGGGNRGMSRSYSNQTYQNQPTYRPQPQQPRNYQQPQQNYQQAQQPQRPAGNGVGRMIGAGVAGAAIGAMAGHALANSQHENNNQPNQQLPESVPTTANQNNQQIPASAPVTADQHNQLNPQMPASTAMTADQTPQPAKSNFSWLWLIVLALGGFFLFRRFKNNNQSQPQPPMSGFNPPAQSNYQNANSVNTNVFGQSLQGNTPSSNTPVADGTQPEAFLRFAKQRFNHVQSMNHGSNLEEIRRYFTPEMFADVQQDIVNNQDIAEFSDLNTELVGSTQENGQYIAGVRFSGLVSEELGSQPVPFSETWHFVKPVGSQSDWLIAGIQQN